MCGINGVLHFDGRSVDIDMLRRMNDALIHRGPDGEGVWSSRQAGLGFRRLSIIDPERSARPVTNEDERIVLICNGEIYNYRELRRDLSARGHRFRTDEDAETIVHLYEEHGTRCVHYLRGMFAFILWDGRTESWFAISASCWNNSWWRRFPPPAIPV